MARKPRLSIPGVAQHVIQRGNNRCATFSHRRDYHFYLECLLDAANRFDCQVHAYVLMANHVHLLVTPMDEAGTSRMMHHLGGRYVGYYNKCNERTGTLWDGRFKSSLIDSEAYLFTCMRYIELNPVRAGMVQTPADYRWSSYQANALGRVDPVITPHALLMELGADRKTRATHYSALFGQPIPVSVTDEIRAMSSRGWALGRPGFVKRISSLLPHVAGPVRRRRK